MCPAMATPVDPATSTAVPAAPIRQRRYATVHSSIPPVGLQTAQPTHSGEVAAQVAAVRRDAIDGLRACVRGEGEPGGFGPSRSGVCGGQGRGGSDRCGGGQRCGLRGGHGPLAAHRSTLPPTWRRSLGWQRATMRPGWADEVQWMLGHASPAVRKVAQRCPLRTRRGAGSRRCSTTCIEARSGRISVPPCAPKPWSESVVIVVRSLC